MTSNETKSFELGILAITPNALNTIHPEDVLLALVRHGDCDWGDCSSEDAKENDFSVDKHLRILSVYHDRNGVKFWIITEADRSSTMVLLPEDY
jgi:hypothetical protein